MASPRIERLNNPTHFAQVARRHTNAFRWRPQGHIPLGIHVVNPAYSTDLDYRQWLDPEPWFEFQTRVLADTLSVESDLLPAVGINHLGDAALTSVFGAEQRAPVTCGKNVQDAGPTPIPILSDIEEVAALSLPSLDAGIMPDVRRIVRYYRERLPAWVHLVAPMPTGPFSAAMELRGSDLMLDLVDRPQPAERLIDLCTRTCVAIEMDARRVAATPLDSRVTNFGVLGAGLRLGEDSLVNLSPGMIQRFGAPVVRTVNASCGGRGHVHFCSLPHSRFEHMYDALAEMPEVAVASSQFGFEYYQHHLDQLRGRLAIESFYGDGRAYVCEKYGSFDNWASDFVPKFKNESGLALYCEVASIDEGRDLWAAWMEAHRG